MGGAGHGSLSRVAIKDRHDMHYRITLFPYMTYMEIMMTGFVHLRNLCCLSDFRI